MPFVGILGEQLWSQREFQQNVHFCLIEPYISVVMYSIFGWVKYDIYIYFFINADGKENPDPGAFD